MSQVRPIEDLFAELIELKSPAEREAYLDKPVAKITTFATA